MSSPGINLHCRLQNCMCRGCFCGRGHFFWWKECGVSNLEHAERGGGFLGGKPMPDMANTFIPRNAQNNRAMQRPPPPPHPRPRSRHGNREPGRYSIFLHNVLIKWIQKVNSSTKSSTNRRLLLIRMMRRQFGWGVYCLTLLK